MRSFGVIQKGPASTSVNVNRCVWPGSRVRAFGPRKLDSLSMTVGCMTGHFPPNALFRHGHFSCVETVRALLSSVLTIGQIEIQNEEPVDA